MSVTCTGAWLELSARLQPGEAAADNDDAVLAHRSSVSLSFDTISPTDSNTTTAPAS